MHRSREKYRNAEFLFKFVNETVHNFEKENEEVIIPEWLFDVSSSLPCQREIQQVIYKEKRRFYKWLDKIDHNLGHTHVKLIKKTKCNIMIVWYIGFYAHVQII